jgi:hypothetical protein
MAFSTSESLVPWAKDTTRRDDMLQQNAPGATPGMHGLEPAAYTNMSIKIGDRSTVEDLYRWDRALRNGELLSRSSRESLFPPTRWSESRQVIHHSGRSPGFNAQVWRFIDDDATVIVLSNNYAGVADRLSRNLAAVVVSEQPEDRMKELIPVRVNPAILETYVGRYKWQPPFSDTFEVDRDGDQLFTWGNERRREPLIAQSDTTFVHPVTDEGAFRRGHSGSCHPHPGWRSGRRGKKLQAVRL